MDLIDLIDNATTDKNTIHSYLPLYQALFKKKQYTARHVMEVGIGGSIQLWHDFFLDATIHGIDLNEKMDDKFKDRERIVLYTPVDAYNEEFVENRLRGIRFDVILDDGSHRLNDVRIFIRLYSRLLSDDGILLVEDIQDMRWIDQLQEEVPADLRRFIHVYDRRKQKGRYDDIVFVIDKSNHRKYIGIYQDKFHSEVLQSLMDMFNETHNMIWYYDEDYYQNNVYYRDRFPLLQTESVSAFSAAMDRLDQIIVSTLQCDLDYSTWSESHRDKLFGIVHTRTEYETYKDIRRLALTPNIDPCRYMIPIIASGIAEYRCENMNDMAIIGWFYDVKFDMEVLHQWMTCDERHRLHAFTKFYTPDLARFTKRYGTDRVIIYRDLSTIAIINIMKSKEIIILLNPRWMVNDLRYSGSISFAINHDIPLLTPAWYARLYPGLSDAVMTFDGSMENIRPPQNRIEAIHSIVRRNHRVIHDILDKKTLCGCLVEPRSSERDRILLLIENFRSVLPDVMLFIFTDVPLPEMDLVRVVSIHTDNLISSQYSDMLKTASFWDHFENYDFVLTVQTDGCLCPDSPHKIQEFMRYDYVGGYSAHKWWWKETKGLHSYEKDYQCFNGGFSLRRIRSLRRVIQTFPPQPTPAEFREGQTIPQYAEDLYFVAGMLKLGLPVGLEEHATKFCTHTHYVADTFCVHQLNRHVSRSELQRFLSFCPAFDSFF